MNLKDILCKNWINKVYLDSSDFGSRNKEDTNLETFKLFVNKIYSVKFFTWVLVGTFTVAIDTTIFVLVFDQTKIVILSNLLSSSCATIFNYISHHRITFKSEQTHKSAGYKYLLTLFSFWCVNTLVVKILLLLIAVPAIAKLAAAALQAPFSYFILNKVVFRGK